MLRAIALVLIAGVTSGCLMTRHRQRRVAIEKRTAKMRIHQKCNGVETRPGTQMVTVKSWPRPFTTKVRCGLVVHDVGRSAFVDKFVASVCGGAPDEACEQKFSDMFFARLGQRYRYANWADVSQRCTAYPTRCNRRQIELWALHSHDVAVRKAGRRALVANAQEFEQRRQMAMISAQASKPLRCVSKSQVGGDVVTECQ